MRLYLASSIKAKALMLDWRDRLMAHGHHITSRWLDISVPSVSPEQARMYAIGDFEDIAKSDGMIVYGGEESTYGGFHIEMGFWIGRNWWDRARDVKPIIYISDGPSSVFHHYDDVRNFKSLDEALSWTEWWKE